MHDPKLVEALADFAGSFVGVDGGGDIGEALAQAARDFLTAHRIVQLPEEPVGWVPVDEKRVAILGGVRKHKRDAEAYALPVHPVYIIPGDPQEVDDG